MWKWLQLFKTFFEPFKNKHFVAIWNYYYRLLSPTFLFSAQPTTTYHFLSKTKSKLPWVPTTYNRNYDSHKIVIDSCSVISIINNKKLCLLRNYWNGFKNGSSITFCTFYCFAGNKIWIQKLNLDTRPDIMPRLYWLCELFGLVWNSLNCYCHSHGCTNIQQILCDIHQSHLWF